MYNIELQNAPNPGPFLLVVLPLKFLFSTSDFRTKLQFGVCKALHVAIDYIGKGQEV